jgi:D-beta-D-heptose 7-phosphate kinase/D-beta-D-heptose 1-phosphate adenosyltransferase
MDINDLKNIVKKFIDVRILIIGDLRLDTFIRGDITRISDEAPVPVLDFNSEIVRPGGAGNAISNIRALGGTVIAFGVIGNDPEGNCLKTLLSDTGVDANGILICDSRRTTKKTRIIAQKFQQHILRIDKNNSVDIDARSSGILLKSIKNVLDSVDAILISDDDDGVITTELLEELIPLAKTKGKTIVIDSKAEHFLDYRDVDIVKVSQQVASDITGIGKINETSVRNIGQWMLTQLGSNYVLITQGKDGMTLFGKRGEVFHIPSIAKELKEVTGVADTVAAVLALSLGVDRNKMTEAAVLANTTAGIKVGKLGTATVSSDELICELDRLVSSSVIQEIPN